MPRRCGPRRELPALEESLRARYRAEGLTPGVVESFHRFLARFSRSHGRDLPWRRTTDPYQILVSEFMLQQTQVGRVLVKYPEFLGRFPDIGALARAPVQEVLLAWQGLGYNRRALALHRTARRITEEYHGEVPLDRATLDSFPGIGNATAGAIIVFSTNRPEVFIETNIRRVYIHLFFPGTERVHDREILPLLDGSLDREEPRRFYYALMDYGVYLNRNLALLNPNKRSASYHKQSPFSGSDREMRGNILRLLLAGDVSEHDLFRALNLDPAKGVNIMETLEREGFTRKKGTLISIIRE